MLTAILRENVGVVVPEYELKPRKTWPSPDRFDFSGADQIVDFAAANGMQLRGHTLIWHQANPDWLPAVLEQKPGERFLTDYVQMVVGRYRGKMRDWDVVNEAVDPKNGSLGLFGASPWFKAFGPECIEIAYRAAKEADPGADLYYCETNTEMDVGWNEQRRQAALLLVDRLLSKGAPLNGFAVQGHIKPFLVPFNQEKYAKFLADVRSLGLKIIVSEFDVIDRGGDPDTAKRDIAVASATKAFLDVVLDNPATTSVLTWGLSDKYSWLSADPGYRWPDGQLSRGLPLDAKMQKKPMWQAIAASLSDARKRS